MTAFPTEYPANREWDITEGVAFERHQALKDGWANSRERLAAIRDRLAGAGLEAAVETIAVAGSLGRMEASEQSDFDAIVVLKQGVPLEGVEATAVDEALWRAVEPLGLRRPKPTGVFARPTNLDRLRDSRFVGKADEDLTAFGKRLLLLLETQPVFAPEAYEQVISSVVDLYAQRHVAGDPAKEWSFLINDLIRYFRAVCVNYQWDFENENGKWPLRNVKLRHSRMIMYAGLLALLGECSKERRDKVGWLKARLKMTPLERLAWAYAENRDWNFFRVAGFYNAFLSRLGDEEVRRALNVDPEEDTYGRRYANPYYAELKANSDGLIAELLRFILARRGAWTERFFEYLVF